MKNCGIWHACSARVNDWHPGKQQYFVVYQEEVVGEPKEPVIKWLIC